MTFSGSPLRSRTEGENEIHDLQAFLAGAWTVRRVVVDRVTRQVFRFDGTAVFAADVEGELAYNEGGVLAGGGRHGSATRRLTYRFLTPRRAAVYFADNRPFHELDLSAGRQRVVHDCAPDRYRAVFAVDRGDLLVRWRVLGPDTSYVSTTRFTRMAMRECGFPNGQP